MEMNSDKTGLNEAEFTFAMKIAEASALFEEILPNDSEMVRFYEAIGVVQNILALRAAKTAYPEFWGDQEVVENGQ